jgi:hypothetical protein
VSPGFHTAISLPPPPATHSPGAPVPHPQRNSISCHQLMALPNGYGCDLGRFVSC